MNIKSTIGDTVAMKIQQIMIHEHQTLTYNIPYKQTTKRNQVNGLVTYDKKLYDNIIRQLLMLTLSSPEYKLRKMELEITTVKGKQIQVLLWDVRVTAVNQNITYTRSQDLLQFDYDAKQVEVINID